MPRCACARMMYRNNTDGTRDYKLQGKSSCPLCHGYGRTERCIACNGAGIAANQRCASCNGNGLMPPNSQTEPYDERNEF